MSEALLVAVLRGLLTCMAFLEMADDTQVDPDAAVKTLECVGDDLSGLTVDERTTLAGLILAEAEREPAGMWREQLLRFADGLRRPIEPVAEA